MTNKLSSNTVLSADQLLQANELKRKKEYKEVISLYIKEIERVGENADLYAAIAICFFSLALRNPDETGENHNEAIAWMRKAIALAPDDSRMHAHLGQFYELGTLDYDQAALEYRKAIELSPYDVRILFDATSLYGPPESVVTLDEAINWLERAVRLEPDNPNYHVRLGDLYREAGQLSDAKLEYLRALLCPKPLDTIQTKAIKIKLGIENN
jgi:tetratricopeptide (TPR) repeat protein